MRSAVLLSVYIAFCCAFRAQAQPTIQSGNSSYVAGESYLYWGNNSGSLTSGPNITWDETGFNLTASVWYDYLSPTTGGGINGATVALNDDFSAGYTYFQATPSAFTELGKITTDLSYTCSDPRTVFPYPFTYGSELTDAFSCSGTIGGQPFVRTGTVELSAPGYGTLLLPFGTLTDVLLIDSQEHSIDTFVNFPDSTIDRYTNVRMLVKPGIRPPLMISFSSYSSAGDFASSFMMLYDEDIGITETQAGILNMEVCPNPANGLVTVRYMGGSWAGVSLEVYDVAGRVIIQRQALAKTDGVQREVLDVSSLPAGLYAVKLVDENGGMVSKTLLVD